VRVVPLLRNIPNVLIGNSHGGDKPEVEKSRKEQSDQSAALAQLLEAPL
jgi:hypothetical protein